jgi:hypothetical protein
VAQLLPLLDQFSRPEATAADARELSVALEQLQRALLLVRPRAELMLDKMCFCRGIERFGVFDPLPVEHVFVAGGDNRRGEPVQVYVEVRNFTSMPREEQYATALGVSLSIVDYSRRSQGETVWRQDRPARLERSRSPVDDCFLNCQFFMPRLPMGRYTLLLEVKDVTGNAGGEPPAYRIARSSLDFRVSGNAEGDRK